MHALAPDPVHSQALPLMLDQITNLLHRELARKLRQADGRKAAEAAAPRHAPPQHDVRIDPRSALRARIGQLSASGVIDETVLIRAITEHLLRNEFGDELVNTAPFHALTDRMTHTASRIPEFKAMLLAIAG